MNITIILDNLRAFEFENRDPNQKPHVRYQNNEGLLKNHYYVRGRRHNCDIKNCPARIHPKNG